MVINCHRLGRYSYLFQLMRSYNRGDPHRKRPNGTTASQPEANPMPQKCERGPGRAVQAGQCLGESPELNGGFSMGVDGVLTCFNHQKGGHFLKECGEFF
jgi:hypothetical protein